MTILKLFKFVIVQITLNKVLLVGTKTHTYIGKPVVTNAAVHAIVEEQVVHQFLSNASFLRFSYCLCFALPNFSLDSFI